MKRPRRGPGALLALLLLLPPLCGCDTLPGGEPPAGNLADNSAVAETELARHNHLVTQLIAYSLQAGVRALDPGPDERCSAIARDAARVAGFRIAAAASLKLALERSPEGAETLTLRDAERRLVWRSLPPRRP